GHRARSARVRRRDGAPRRGGRTPVPAPESDAARLHRHRWRHGALSRGLLERLQRMTRRWLFLLAALCFAAERKVIFPPGAKPVGPYSPGIMAGEFLYVSGQGVRRPDGTVPEGFDAQARQCLENIKTIVEAAGLSMEHIVYTQMYLQDTA